MCKRKWTDIGKYEEQIKKLREAGYTKREIAEKLGLEKSQIKNWIARENRRKRKAVNGEPLRRKGRPMKETTEAELERLRMENKLLRDFLQLTERK